MGFEFKRTVDISHDVQRFDPLLYEYTPETGYERHVLVLLERLPLSKKYVAPIANQIRYHLGKKTKVSVLSSIDFSETEDSIKRKGIYRFYKKHSINIKKYIELNSIVLSLGFSISNITRSSDLTVECFQDWVFNKGYFFSPELGTWVFPVDGLSELVNMETGLMKNCSKVQFMALQLSSMNLLFDTLLNDREQDTLILHKLSTTQDWKAFYNVQKKTKSPVSWDIETTGLNFLVDDIICVTMSFDGKEGYYIPWEVIDKQDLIEFFHNRYQIGQNLKFDCEFLLFKGINTVKIDSDTLQLGQTLNEMRKNGLKSLAYHYTKHGGYDYALDAFIEDNSPKNYSYIPENLLFQYATKDAILTYQINQKLEEQLTLQDKKFPPERRGGWTTREFYEKIKIPSVNKFVEMEVGGVYINMAKWDENSDILEKKVRDIKETLALTLGVSLDDESFSDLFGNELTVAKEKDGLQSSEKLGRRLEELKWKCLGRAKKGHFLTGDSQLTRWEELGYKEASLLRKMRSLLTLQQTFLGKKGTKMGWRQYVHYHSDGSYRIHPSYRAMLMDTMRNGCGNPNYQQVPSHSENAELFKQIFTVPDPDKYYLVTLDYSSFQIRLATIDILDTSDSLFQSFINNPKLDLHSVTGYNVFAQGRGFNMGDGKERLITLEEFIKNKKREPFATMRQDAKAINFGCLFNISYKRFSESSLETGENPWSPDKVARFVEEYGLEASLDSMADRHRDVEPKIWGYYAVAQYLIEKFFETYPGLMKRIKRNERLAKERGYIRSYHGVIRRLPMLPLGWKEEDNRTRSDEDKKIYAGYINIASNTSIQSDEVCTIQQKMCSWDKSIPSGMVHDSYDSYVLKEGYEDTIQAMKEHFTSNDKWQKGLVVPVDITVCDFNNPDHYYKNGDDF